MNALVIMAKEPVVGKVKTRLTPTLSPEAAKELYIGFLLDKIAQVAEIEDTSHFIAYYPETGREFFQAYSPDSFKLIEQKGLDLGERLAGVSSELIGRGFNKVLMLDSDSPNLPSSYIKEGLSSLDETDIVLGPTDDGGYYLVGLKEPIPEMFMDIPWSTSEVTEVTKQKIAGLGKSLFLLKNWYDVDTKDSLKKLKMDLIKAYEIDTDQFLCVNTIKSINEIDEP